MTSEAVFTGIACLFPQFAVLAFAHAAAVSIAGTGIASKHRGNEDGTFEVDTHHEWSLVRGFVCAVLVCWILQVLMVAFMRLEALWILAVFPLESIISSMYARSPSHFRYWDEPLALVVEDPYAAARINRLRQRASTMMHRICALLCVALVGFAPTKPLPPNPLWNWATPRAGFFEDLREGRYKPFAQDRAPQPRSQPQATTPALVESDREAIQQARIAFVREKFDRACAASTEPVRLALNRQLKDIEEAVTARAPAIIQRHLTQVGAMPAKAGTTIVATLQRPALRSTEPPSIEAHLIAECLRSNAITPSHPWHKPLLALQEAIRSSGDTESIGLQIPVKARYFEMNDLVSRELTIDFDYRPPTAAKNRPGAAMHQAAMLFLDRSNASASVQTEAFDPEWRLEGIDTETLAVTLDSIVNAFLKELSLIPMLIEGSGGQPVHAADSMQDVVGALKGFSKARKSTVDAALTRHLEQVAQQVDAQAPKAINEFLSSKRTLDIDGAVYEARVVDRARVDSITEDAAWALLAKAFCSATIADSHPCRNSILAAQASLKQEIESNNLGPDRIASITLPIWAKWLRVTPSQYWGSDKELIAHQQTLHFWCKFSRSHDQQQPLILIPNDAPGNLDWAFYDRRIGGWPLHGIKTLKLDHALDQEIGSFLSTLGVPGTPSNEAPPPP